MIVKLADFSKAIAKVMDLASGEKNIPGIMLDISDEGLKVCYSDNRRALIEKVEAVIEDTDVRGKVVLDYARLTSAIAICQPSGRLSIDELYFTFNADNKVTLYADKKLLVQRGEESTHQKVSTFEQVLTWAEAGSNMRTALLSRENYDSIFTPAGEITEVDIGVLRNILLKTTTEKGKQVYFSPANEEAFVCNLAYVTSIPLNGEIGLPIVMTSATGKCIADIINRLDADKLHMHTVDNKFCKMFTEDHSFGLSFEILPANRTHLNTLDRYKSKDYSTVQLTFFKEILLNVIKSASAVSASEKVNLRLERNDEGNVELLVAGSNTNASIDNNYRVVTNGFNFKDNDKDGTEEKIIKEFDVPIALKVLNDIVTKCDTDYIAFDISHEEGANARAVRIAEVDIDKLILEQDLLMSGGVTEAVEQPVVEQPVVEQPVVEQPVVEQPVVEQPVDLSVISMPSAAMPEMMGEEEDDVEPVVNAQVQTKETSLGEFQKAKTVVGIHNVGGASKDEVFEIEELSDKPVNAVTDATFEITMNDKLEFRHKTLGATHYTMAAK